MSTQSPTGIFENYNALSFTADGGEEIFFGAESIKEDGGNRLARHRRMHSRGARLDGSGEKERTWSIRSVFHNVDWEAEDLGIPENEVYPQQLNKLIDSFKEQVTGTLWLPTRGPVRARCESYVRVESHDLRDTGVVDLLFVEDNEDDSWSSSFAPPGTDGVDADGMDGSLDEIGSSISDAMAEITDLGSQIEDLITAPSDFVDMLDRQADHLQRAAEGVQNAFNYENERMQDSSVLDPLGVVSLLNSAADETVPGNMTTGERARAAGSQARIDTSIRIFKIKEFAATAQARATRTTGRTLPKISTSDLSLFDVATEQGISVGDLIKLNGALDPLLVPAGTPIVMPTRKVRRS